MTRRFAIYYAPARDAALTLRAEAWLARPDLQAETVSARRYGFHATLKAPMEIAGHTRYPRTRIAAKAIPADGHTGDALACNEASIKPNLPTTK